MYSKADLIKVMDLLEVNENSAAELITERNISLPPILISFYLT